MEPPIYKHENASKNNLIEFSNNAAVARKQSGKRSGKEKDNASRKKPSHAFFSNMDSTRAAELRAIAAVEAQLGEPLREDCPMLGIEFDVLPRDAFSSFTAPLASYGVPQMTSHVQEKSYGATQSTIQGLEKSYGAVQSAACDDDRRFEQTHILAHKSAKGAQFSGLGSGTSGSFNIGNEQAHRAVHEYKFIPDKPMGKLENPHPDNILTRPNFFVGGSHPADRVTPRGSFLHGNDALATSVGFQDRTGTVANSPLPPLDGSAGGLFSKGGLNFDGLRQELIPGFTFDNQIMSNHASFQLLSDGISYLNSDNLAQLHEQDQARLDKKRKIEEARIAKEVEAHEKRIRREIERQDNARRKRDEQLRKELEKQRKEAERVIRDRQREEERLLREHRREMERRERVLEKEFRRVERQRQKDESRRQKEVERLKVANERALQKKLARESIELIDDERLELLEAAAVNQDLPSIYLLDGETLNDLDQYKGSLKKFPPVSVKMKKPFASQPWVDSKKNVGNLLMVWRFLTAFADILGIWCFTLDELVQAFHDYDPRLLGEVHIALLKTIVKDVRDVAEASSVGLGGNQTVLGFSGGGHPLLVEAAFAWGFDICEWQQHLNPQTWPEILRQFGLSAGYGPRWKKHTSEPDRTLEDNEGKEAEAIINTLRSGEAVENAVSQMEGKGGRRRKKRHRLTPGTVKFAAFHVLSIEGESGLSILEVAERIQQSGLRDLSTSRTPEASIAAALSRDTKLFERVAPSTYCVRVAYRKDPEEAENILQTAREKIRLFQSRSTEEDDVEKEQDNADEAEKEEDTDEDIEDVEGDEIEGVPTEAEPNLNKDHVGTQQHGLLTSDAQQQTYDNISEKTPSMNISFTQRDNKDNKGGSINIDDSTSSGQEACVTDKVVSNKIHEEIDENHLGEPWVQGLADGEYCDLSIEERLEAVVALIDVVNEGNTVRVALEERLEAANFLKKQLWAETQLDKRRCKEEQLLKVSLQQDEGFKTETVRNGEVAFESPIGGAEKGAETRDSKLDLTLDTVNKQADPESDPAGAEKSISNQGLRTVQDMPAAFPHGGPAEKSRAQLKAEISIRAEELFVYRSLPLGFDRRYNRYWQFKTSNNDYDPGCGRIFFETSEDDGWHVIDTQEAYDELIASLDTRGIREAHLHGVFHKIENQLKERMQKSHVFQDRCDKECSSGSQTDIPRLPLTSAQPSSVDSVSKIAGDGETPQAVGAFCIGGSAGQAERENALKHYCDSDTWLWSKCMRGNASLNAMKYGTKRRAVLMYSCDTCHDLFWPRDRHCSYCHMVIEGAAKMESKVSLHTQQCREKHRSTDWMFLRVLPSRIQLLKAELFVVEAAIPSEALKSGWIEAKRKAWAFKIKQLTSPGELLQAISELEAAVKRDWISPSYETTEELLSIHSERSSTGLECLGVNGVPALLPWLPQTTAAAALRLMVFDAALFYSPEQKDLILKQGNNKSSTEVAPEARSVPATTSVKEEETGEDSTSEEDEDEEEEDEEEEEEEDEEEAATVTATTNQPMGHSRGRGSRVRGRGRGRGRGRSSSSRNLVGSEISRVTWRKPKSSEGEVNVSSKRSSSSRSLPVRDTPKVVKGKAKSSEADAVSDHQVDKEGRQRRGRGGRGRGKGRSRDQGYGRGRGRGLGRGRGRGRGRSSTVRGRGCNTRGGHNIQSLVVKKAGRQSMSTKRNLIVIQQDQSDEDSHQSDEWEEDRGFKEHGDTYYEDENYNEDNETGGFNGQEIGNDMGQEEEQESESEANQEEDQESGSDVGQEEDQMFDDYGNDYNGRFYTPGNYAEQGYAEDSVEEDQLDNEMRGEEDEEEDERFQSSASGSE